MKAVFNDECPQTFAGINGAGNAIFDIDDFKDLAFEFQNIKSLNTRKRFIDLFFDLFILEEPEIRYAGVAATLNSSVPRSQQAKR